MKNTLFSTTTAWWWAGALTLGCVGPEGLEEDFAESRQPLVFARTTEFVATHDARIKERLPTTNYGAYSPMCAQIEDGGTDEWVVFKFNTPGLVAPFSRATLRLYLGVDGGTPHNFRIYNSTNTTWDETVTWNTRPTPGTAYVTVPGGSADNSYFDIDVTPLINPALTTQTLIIKPVASTDTNALCLVDRASPTILQGESTQPRLVVDYFGAVPTADALVDEATPDTNSGAAPTLSLSATAPARRAYLQVPISRTLLNDLRGIQLHGTSIPANVGSPRGRVMLRLYPTTTVSGTSAVVYAPPSGTNWTTWSETGLTWANQPAGTGAPNATAIASLSNTVAGRWIEVDVTQAVTHATAWADALTTTKQDLSLNLLLAGGTGTFASKEDPTFKPMLVFISDQLPTVKTDGICGRGEDCANSPTDCGVCATGTNRGAYLPVWGDLHRHGLGDGKDGWDGTELRTHTTNVLTYLKNTEKLDFVALSEHVGNDGWEKSAGFARQVESVDATRVAERFIPSMGAETSSYNGAIETHMKFDIASKGAGTYSAVKLRIKVQNASADGQFKVRRQIRCNSGGTLSPAWYSMAKPGWPDRWSRAWEEKKDLFPGNIPLESWYDIDVSELLLVNGTLYTKMSGDCSPDPDTLSNVVLAITVGTVTTDALGFYTRDSAGGVDAPRLVFFINGVEQAGPISTNADQRFDSTDTASGAGTHSSTEPTTGIDLTNSTGDPGNFSMGHFNILFPPANINMDTYNWTNGTTRNWKNPKTSNRVYYDYLDDTANDWLGQINHPFSIDYPMVDMTVAPGAVARMATYELSGGTLERWTNTAYYANSWQPKINRYLQYVRHGWRVAPAANSDAHCSCTTSTCSITAHNCPSTVTGTRTGMWTLGRNFTALKQALSQKRAFAVQNGPGLEDKNVYVALEATQSSAFDSSWWMGSVLPNRSAWTLTAFAKNFNVTGTVKINRITLHDDDGYGAIATLQCGGLSSCSGSFNYTPGAANKAVIAVAELSTGHYVVSAPMFF
ncbi:CBM96 family carbohydrate-binding protein [Corallococcus llansteffanensis]|uniref:DNRLRE domain-containing protein n=1 Tax=Corallococcus llansteffanensis TaxID=2316731 RepID=A0A3A8PJN7_9BACT|nr:DNRLRE domain-containing protein [Corallococcus llansteffanensis]RKH56269.1 DNRLRE domain-containing protein [Corallococcus llansteffanensis]